MNLRKIVVITRDAQCQVIFFSRRLWYVAEDTGKKYFNMNVTNKRLE